MSDQREPQNWLGQSTSSESSDNGHKSTHKEEQLGVERETRQLEQELQAKQESIGDLSNMLERSEDTFETVLLDVLQKSEEVLPKIICESVLVSICAGRKVVDQTCVDQFTRQRIIRDKLKNLRHLVSVLAMLGPADHFGLRLSAHNESFRVQIERIMRQSENFLKETKNGKREERFYLRFFQNVHDFWDSINGRDKPSQMSNWKQALEKWESV